MDSKIIIFVQAPADVPYMLKIYEDNLKNNKKDIYLYVVNVYNVYKFILELNLGVNRITYIPYIISDLKRIDKFYNERKRLKKIWKNEFKDDINSEVYFFSTIADWITSYFIKRLEAKKNFIFYVEHYDSSHKVIESHSWKLKVFDVLLFVLTGIVFERIELNYMIKFPYTNYKISLKDIDIGELDYNKYNISFSLTNKLKSVLLLIGPFESIIYQNHDQYNNILKQVINIFKENNYKVYAKGHPRLGFPENINDGIDYIIPSYIIAEFINIEMFSYVVGINSTSIAHFAKNNSAKVLSINNMFDFVSEEIKNITIKHLVNVSDNNIIFCDSLESLDDYIDKN